MKTTETETNDSLEETEEETDRGIWINKYLKQSSHVVHANKANQLLGY